MAANIPAVNVVTTKLADGNVRFDFYDGAGVNGGSVGDLRFACVMSSANVTAINTTVNGGSSGTTLTQPYAENANPSDYVQGMTFSV